MALEFELCTFNDVLVSHEKPTDKELERFVAIAGVGTSPPGEWSDLNKDIWPKSTRAESAPDIGIFSFPNELVTED